jgi:hypothetical protein
VRELLAEHVDSGAELGAAIAITVDGVPVVGMGGGWAYTAAAFAALG